MSRYGKYIAGAAVLGGGALLIHHLLRDEPQGEPAKISAPVAEPNVSNPRARINRSTHDEDGTVQQTPAELLAQARRHDATITMDELTGARLAASEHYSGTFTELACIVDAELNRAKRRKKSLTDSLTYNGTYGRQGLKRRASTRRDPAMRHVLAARAVLSGAARGVARGAIRFFDPVAMDRQNRKYKAWVAGGREGKKPLIVTCDALGLLEAWSYDLGRDPRTKSRCPPNHARRGKRPQMWVGPIPGVDATRLMLMKPAQLGPGHTRRFEEARDLIRQRQMRS